MKEGAVTWGQELPREVWLRIAENLKGLACTTAEMLMRDNPDGEGKEMANELLVEMQLAYTAVRYVADNARDKCRVLPVPDKL